MTFDANQIYFLSYGEIYGDNQTKLIVYGNKVEELFNYFCEKMKLMREDSFVAVNKTYVCFDGWVEQGDVVLYKNFKIAI